MTWGDLNNVGVLPTSLISQRPYFPRAHTAAHVRLQPAPCIGPFPHLVCRPDRRRCPQRRAAPPGQARGERLPAPAAGLDLRPGVLAWHGERGQGQRWVDKSSELRLVSRDWGAEEGSCQPRGCWGPGRWGGGETLEALRSGSGPRARQHDEASRDRLAPPHRTSPWRGR